MLFPYQKKQQKLFIILAIVILVVIGVLYFGLREPETSVDQLTAPGGFAIPAAPISEEAPTGQKPVILNSNPEEAGGKIELDVGFFKNPQYQDLRSYEAWPGEKGGVGRENPFAPY